MKEKLENVGVALKPGFAAEVAIDGFGVLKRGSMVAIPCPPHVVKHFRASSMFEVKALPDFAIKAGQTPVKLGSDGPLGLITKGSPTGPWLVQVPGEEQERNVDTGDFEEADGAELFAAAKKALKDPWKTPRWLEVGLAAGLKPPTKAAPKSAKEST